MLRPVTTVLPPAPEAVLQLVKCACKGNCTKKTCSCKKHSMYCTDMCTSCEESCENRNVTVSEDSEDETSVDFLGGLETLLDLCPRAKRVNFEC